MYSDDEDDNILNNKADKSRRYTTINFLIDKIEKIEGNITEYLIEYTTTFDLVTGILNSDRNKIQSIISKVKYTIETIKEIASEENELDELAKIKTANIMLFLFRFLYSKGCRTLYFAYDDLKNNINTLIDDNIETAKDNLQIYGYPKLYDFLIMMKFSLI